MTKTIQELEKEMRILDQMDTFSDDEKRTVAIKWNLFSGSLIFQNEEKEDADYQRFRQFAGKHAQQKALDLLATISRPTDVDRANFCVQTRWLVDSYLNNKALPEAIQASERSLSFQERFPHTIKELAQSYFDTGYLYLIEVNQALIKQEKKATTEQKAEEKQAVITLTETPEPDRALIHKALAYLEFAADNEHVLARKILIRYYYLYKKMTFIFHIDDNASNAWSQAAEKVLKALSYAAENQVYLLKAEKILDFLGSNLLNFLELRKRIVNRYIEVIDAIAASQDKDIAAFYRLIDDEGYPLRILLTNNLDVYAYICEEVGARLGAAQEQMTSALISRGYNSTKSDYFHSAKTKENSESHVIDATLSASSGNFPRDILRTITGYMGIDDHKGTNLLFWKSVEAHGKKKRKNTDNGFGKALQDRKKWQEQVTEGGSQALEAAKHLEEMCDTNQDLNRVDSDAATQKLEDDLDETMTIKPGM